MSLVVEEKVIEEKFIDDEIINRNRPTEKSEMKVEKKYENFGSVPLFPISDSSLRNRLVIIPFLSQWV